MSIWDRAEIVLCCVKHHRNGVTVKDAIAWIETYKQVEISRSSISEILLGLRRLEVVVRRPAEIDGKSVFKFFAKHSADTPAAPL